MLVTAALVTLVCACAWRKLLYATCGVDDIEPGKGVGDEVDDCEDTGCSKGVAGAERFLDTVTGTIRSRSSDCVEIPEYSVVGCALVAELLPWLSGVFDLVDAIVIREMTSVVGKNRGGIVSIGFATAFTSSDAPASEDNSKASLSVRLRTSSKSSSTVVNLGSLPTSAFQRL